jgi:hypothetical protein
MAEGTTETQVATPLPASGAERPSFEEFFKTWLKIGCLSFGGPAGQIAMMHRIVVDEKKWVDEPRFLHALNFCVLSPGPEAQKPRPASAGCCTACVAASPPAFSSCCRGLS